MSNGLYSRQSDLTLLSYQNAVVVGLGGIGNWVALELALSGCVTNLILIDPDEVEEHNLNRTIFKISDIGQKKVDAVKYQILERRPTCLIETYAELTNEKLLTSIADKVIIDKSVYDRNCLIMDCRDDIYDDLYDFNCKLYKVGYDGTSITIDGNPRLQKVFTQRGGSYRVVPSYIGSASMAAIIAVNDALGAGIIQPGDKDAIDRIDVAVNPYLMGDDGSKRDEYGRLNCCVRFDCSDIIAKCANVQIGNYDKDKIHSIMKEEKDSENEC